MSFIKEFKTFAMKGNVVDLAIGVIIGTSFGKIVTSLVGDILMPPLGILLGGMDFSRFSITLKEKVGDAPAVVLNYGAFLSTIVDFLIIAMVIFMLIKVINRLKTQTPVDPLTMGCPECALQIPIQAKRCGHCCCVIKS